MLVAGKSLSLIPCRLQAIHNNSRVGVIKAEAVGVGGGAASLSLSQALRKVDKALRKGNDREALSIVRDLQGKEDGELRCFGAARQVPQRPYTLEELKLNRIDTRSLLSPVDSTLGSIERNFQIAAALGGIYAWSSFGFSKIQVLLFSVGLLFLWAFDSIGFNGGVRNLLLDTFGHTISRKYHNRVIQHEAGHFLVAYLLGVLPKGYTLSSLEAFRSERFLNVQAGTAFVDFEFLDEVNSGKLSATMLNRYCCIALAGVITEYLLFGYAEGGLDDLNKVYNSPSNYSELWLCIHSTDVQMSQKLICYWQLDGLLKSLGFTQKKADSQVRWAVLNTTLILRRHGCVRTSLAEAMASGKSISSCIDLIERSIDASDL